MTQPESREMNVYCKIVYTEITTVISINSDMSIIEFLEYVKNYAKNNMNINSNYDIELVNMGQPGDELARQIEPILNQTIQDVYRTNYNNDQIGIYIRPINNISREFVRRNDYSI